MKEIADILRAFEQAQAAGKKTALATVVHVEGSSYRRPGARMLVTEDGELTGAISGGCLEGDALRKALLAIQQQQNKLVTYDTSDEDDHTIGIQLGCNGIVYILFEPINSAHNNHPIQLLKAAMQEQEAAVLVTLFNLAQTTAEQPGTCQLITAQQRFGAIRDDAFQSSIDDAVQQVITTSRSSIQHFSNTTNNITAFVEWMQPPVHITIAGAGNDAFPLMQLAHMLGWRVTVADGRKTHANSQRFATASNIITGKPEEVIKTLEPREKKLLILMSHNYNYDLAMLSALMEEPCLYIGVLGPKKKLEKMLDALRMEGKEIPESFLQKIHGPVGLDIGAETAEEIALSIIAEIKSVLAGKNGAALKHKQGFIHDHQLVQSL